MNSVKDIILKPIKSQDAARIIKKFHYSGKVVNKSSLHFGVFLNDRIEGALQFGTSLDHRKMLNMVQGSQWQNFIELNRMAFSDKLPKNSESRAISVAMKIIKKNAPQIKWVVSFADGTQCGDGTIYRAAGFKLTAIKKSFNLAELPSGEVIHKITLECNPMRARPELKGKSYYDVTGGKFDFKKYVVSANAKIMAGFQLRYIGFIDKSWEDRLAVPSLDYSEIDKAGARMYKGKKLGALSDTVDTHGFQP